jgi:hypothetical protein
MMFLAPLMWYVQLSRPESKSSNSMKSKITASVTSGLIGVPLASIVCKRYRARPLASSAKDLGLGCIDDGRCWRAKEA